MAIYRFSLRKISRSDGRSATAAAAYRSGSVIRDDRTGKRHDYRRKAQGVIETALIGWNGSRSELWNEAEKAERRGDSLVAREAQIALPPELSPEDRWVLSLALGEWLHQRYGVAVDVALHAPSKRGDSRNHHAHLLFTTRAVTSDGFGPKTRVLDTLRTGRQEVEKMREVWAELANEVLAEKGITAQLDHRSYWRQGRDRESEHLGWAARGRESRGVQTEQGHRRRKRQSRNRAREARDAARRMPRPVGQGEARRAVIAERAAQEDRLHAERVKRREERVRRLMDRLNPENRPQSPSKAPDAPNPTQSPLKAGQGRSRGPRTP